MKRSDIITVPAFYKTYINLTENTDVVTALEQYGRDYFMREHAALTALGDKVYAPGKWTVKDIVQHLIDAERIFAYRALRICRGDKTPLPAFEENEYALHTTASQRNVDDLLEELCTIRDTTIMLYKNVTPEMLQNETQCSGKMISALAIGFIIAGHGIHHMNVLKDRYYPLISN